jgi:tetratricopeptide (TPR) repeat protein
LSAWLPADRRAFRENVLWALMLVIGTLLAYQRATQAGFIWDDPRHVTENRLLRSSQGLADIWVTSADPKADITHAIIQYYPLTHTTFWIEYHLWGLNPLGYHLDNIILHGLSAVLLWALLVRLGVPAPWLIAAVFAVHPVNVESVAWVTERKNVLSTILYLGAVVAYIRFVTRLKGFETDQAQVTAAPIIASPWGVWGLSFALFVAAMLSKTTACSMPAVMLLLLWWKRKRFTLDDVIPLVPFFIVGIGLGFLTAAVENQRVGAHGPDWDFSFLQRCLIAGNAVWFYFSKLLWPVNLTFSYTRWNIDISRPVLYIAPVATVAVLAALWLARKWLGKGPLVAALIFVGGLFPALGFINTYPMLYSFVADHFQYLPGIAIITLIIGAIAKPLLAASDGSNSFGDYPPVPTALTVVLLAVLSTLTWRHASVFADDRVLWPDTLAKNPGSWMANYNLGVSTERDAQSADEAVRVLERDQRNARASNQLDIAERETAVIEAKRREAAECRERAIRLFQRALELRPQHDRAEHMIGQVLYEQGKYHDAIPHLMRAITINHDNFEAHYNLGMTLNRLEKRDEALAELRKAQALRPKWTGTRLEIADILTAQGKLQEAVDEYIAVRQLDPRNTTALIKGARLLHEMGQDELAFAALAAAIKLKSESVEALTDMGMLWEERGMKLGKPQLVQVARQWYAEALKIDAGYPRAKDRFEATAATLKSWPTTMPATGPATVPTSGPGATTVPSTWPANSDGDTLLPTDDQ